MEPLVAFRPYMQPSKSAKAKLCLERNRTTRESFQYLQWRGHSTNTRAPTFKACSATCSKAAHSFFMSFQWYLIFSAVAPPFKMLILCHMEPPVQGEEYHKESLGPRMLSIALRIPASEAKSRSLVMGTTWHPFDQRVDCESFEPGSQHASTRIRSGVAPPPAAAELAPPPLAGHADGTWGSGRLNPSLLNLSLSS